jgi:hypothetical protein
MENFVNFAQRYPQLNAIELTFNDGCRAAAGIRPPSILMFPTVTTQQIIYCVVNPKLQLIITEVLIRIRDKKIYFSFLIKIFNLNAL